MFWQIHPLNTCISTTVCENANKFAMTWLPPHKPPALFKSHLKQTLLGADLCDAGSCERYDDGHHVNGELKLEELGDAVVDVAAPHDGFDNAGKVVVGQDDVGGLFGYVCASDTLWTNNSENGVLSTTG